RRGRPPSLARRNPSRAPGTLAFGASSKRTLVFHEWPLPWPLFVSSIVCLEETQDPQIRSRTGPWLSDACFPGAIEAALRRVHFLWATLRDTRGIPRSPRTEKPTT